MSAKESYWAYLNRRAAEENNRNVIIEQLLIALPPLIFGGILLMFTNSAETNQVPICSSGIRLVQIAAVGCAIRQFKRYKY